MVNFSELWVLLRQHGSSNKYETECAALWASYTPDMQERIYTSIRTKLAQGRFVHYDPLRAIKENAHAMRQQTLSYAAYYKRYGTTEERDGWQRKFIPEEQRTVYIKAG